MDEVSSGGGMGFGGGGGMAAANPGDDFSRMLGIGIESESIIIKGQDFDKMRNVADDLETFIEELGNNKVGKYKPPG